jgi:hypothetical protein
MALVSDTKSRLALQIDALSMALPMKRHELLPQRVHAGQAAEGQGVCSSSQRSAQGICVAEPSFCSQSKKRWSYESRFGPI